MVACFASIFSAVHLGALVGSIGGGNAWKIQRQDVRRRPFRVVGENIGCCLDRKKRWCFRDAVPALIGWTDLTFTMEILVASVVG